MEMIYARGEATVQDIQAALPDAPGYNSVRKLLSILEEKGHLSHREEGRQYVYFPSHSPQVAAKTALRGLLGTFFKGSPRELMATLLSDEEAHVSAAELEALETMIAAAREKEGQG